MAFAKSLSFALTLHTYTLIPTVYRALLTSAVSGIGHRIHTTKKKSLSQALDKSMMWLYSASTLMNDPRGVVMTADRLVGMPLLN